MLANYLRVAIRNFLRQRLYSFINVLGLFSGLLCTLFIFLWIRDEVQKDKFHKEGDHIFTVASNLDLGDNKITTWTITPGPLAEDIREHEPEVEIFARTMDGGPQLFQYEDKDFLEKGYYADPAFFKVFSFHIEQGSIPSKDDDKSWVAISRDLATRLFGDEDPIGKGIKVSARYDVAVAAVFANVTSQSSLQFDFILPFEIERERRAEGFSWRNFDYPLYLKLSDREKAQTVLAAMNTRASKVKDLEGITFYLQPFEDQYLNSNFENGKPAGGRMKYVEIFTIVAIFILAIACINFMNMATAKAATRIKEVGIRKVVGAQRASLISQFMGESFFLSLFSMLLALMVVYMSLPLFNVLVGKRIVLDLQNPTLVLAVVGIVFITGALSGSYPAFFLSSFHPATILKGTGFSSLGGASLRKGLVIFQFSLTVILVACALIIYRQLSYIRTLDIGYNREAVISFAARGISDKYDAVRDELLHKPGIQMVGRADNTLVQVTNQNGSVQWPGKPDNDQHLFRTVVVDYDFPQVMGLKLIEGRFFSRDFHDTSNFILSRKAVQTMGLKDAIGQKISQWGNNGVVVGVIEDFHSRSVHEAIDPIVMMCKPQWGHRVVVRYKGPAAEAIAGIESTYKKYAPEYPFSYSFVDDDFERLYNNESVTSSLALGFTFMAIIISCLGLLGLASYTTERKRKEISIRKTLGASVSMLVASMSKEFVRLSLIAAVIGCPAAYLLINEFLRGYVYHVDVSWDLFAVTILSVLLVSLLTVIFQVTKAAIANPVDALRNE